MRVVLLIAAGAVWWTLVEYLLHRFAFHPTRSFLRRKVGIGKRHLAHHAMLDVKRLAIAPPISMTVGLALHAAIVFPLLGWSDGIALISGFLGGYVVYELVHFATHYREPRTSLGRYLRAYHLAHHEKTPKARYGVTSPIWDVVFGTYEEVRVSHPPP